jgi:hypothetical protein
LVIVFIEHLQILQVTTCIVLSLIHTLYNSLQHALSLLGLLYLHRLTPGNGFQRRSFLSFRVHVLTGRQISHYSFIAPTIEHIENKKCIQNFSLENIKLKDHLEDLGADEMLILKLVLKKKDTRAYSGYIYVYIK